MRLAGRVSASIRRAKGEDARLVARLLHDFNSEFGEVEPGAVDLERRFAVLLDRDDLVVHLVEEAGAAQGFALTTLRPTPYGDGPLAVLDELYVVPGRRGRGLGSLLLDAVREHCRGLDVEEMHINVDAPDAGARRFYERHGFSHLDDGDEMLLYAGRA
jgi:GNAT superfamily N-acetyltransferase